jgi:hypothetical protein
MHLSILGRSLILLGVMIGCAFAQNETEPLAIAPDETAQSGRIVGRHGKFELYSAAASVGYSSVGNFGTSSSALGSFAPDYDVISSLAVGYNSTGSVGYISLVYTPSYIQRMRFSYLSSFNESLAVSLSRSLAHRGTLRVSFNIRDSTAQQLAFVPSIFANAAATNGTSGDVVRAIVDQPQTNMQLEQVFAQKDTGNAAILAALFGTRVLTGAGHIEYDWAASTRSRLFVSMDISRDQPLTTSGEFRQQTPYNLRSSAGAVVAGWNHSLTPKTTMGLGVDYRRSQSGYFNGDVIDANYTLGREFRSRWFTTLTAGLGRVSVAPQTSGAPVRSTMEWLGSGNVGVKGRIQSVIFHASRSGGDSYGFGANSNTSAGVSWNWQPRRTWSLFLDESYQNLQMGGRSGVVAWAAGAGAEKKIDRQTAVSFSFAYLDGSGQAVTLGQPRLSAYQMQLTLLWSPRAVN